MSVLRTQIERHYTHLDLENVCVHYGSWKRKKFINFTIEMRTMKLLEFLFEERESSKLSYSDPERVHALRSTMTSLFPYSDK